MPRNEADFLLPDEAVRLLDAIRESREVRVVQAVHRQPAAFEPDLASSLNNLGIRFSNLGRREQALQAIEEAVAIHRRLAAAVGTLGWAARHRPAGAVGVESGVGGHLPDIRALRDPT